MFREFLLISATTIFFLPVSVSANDIYVDSNSGLNSNNGTSWEDALLDLEEAFTIAEAGDTIYSNSPSFRPFAPLNIGNIAPNITWNPGDGPDGSTTISGAIRPTGGWQQESDEVFSTPLSHKPEVVAYSLRQDGINGGHTGVKMTHPAILRILTERGIIESGETPPDDYAAWMGIVRESPTATTNPAEGYWSYLNGRMYTNPYSQPNVSNIEYGTVYYDGANGAVFGKSDGLTIEPGLTVFFTPSPNPGYGYGLRFNECTNCTVDGAKIILSGYHAIGFVNRSGKNNKILNSFSFGEAANAINGGSIPWVFYTTEPNMEDAGHVGSNLIIVGYPLFDGEGKPILTNGTYSITSAYSHTDGNVPLGGITYDNLLTLDFTEEIANRHNLPITTSATFVRAGNAPDFASAASSTIHVSSSYGYGRSAIPGDNVAFFDTTFDRNRVTSSLNQNLTRVVSLVNNTGSYKTSITGGEIFTGNYENYFGLVPANGTDIHMDNVFIKSQSTSPGSFIEIYRDVTEPAITLRCIQYNQIQSSHSFIALGNADFDQNKNTFVISHNGNAFSTDVPKVVIRRNGGQAKPAGWWTTNISSRDFEQAPNTKYAQRDECQQN